MDIHFPATVIGYITITYFLGKCMYILGKMLFGMYMQFFVFQPAWNDENRRFKEEKELGEFVSLPQAARMLDISMDKLVEMRSKGDIFGYRDGHSWKFKTREVQRVIMERKLNDI